MKLNISTTNKKKVILIIIISIVLLLIIAGIILYFTYFRHLEKIVDIEKDYISVYEDSDYYSLSKYTNSDNTTDYIFSINKIDNTVYGYYEFYDIAGRKLKEYSGTFNSDTNVDELKTQIYADYHNKYAASGNWQELVSFKTFVKSESSLFQIKNYKIKKSSISFSLSSSNNLIAKDFNNISYTKNNSKLLLKFETAQNEHLAYILSEISTIDINVNIEQNDIVLMCGAIVLNEKK